MHRYILVLGSLELRAIYGDDAYAFAVADRYLRLFWDRYVAHIQTKYPGSLSDSTCSGWHCPPNLMIFRWAPADSAGVWPCRAERIFEEPITPMLRAMLRATRA